LSISSKNTAANSKFEVSQSLKFQKKKANKLSKVKQISEIAED